MVTSTGIYRNLLNSGLGKRPRNKDPNGCFQKIGVLAVGVLTMRALLLGVYIPAPDFWKLPNSVICLCGLLGSYRWLAASIAAGPQ